MRWKAIARYDVGTSHQSQELPCQDYGDYGIFQDVIVGVVADGAGSAKYSDVGSELAVKTVIDWFERVNKSSEQQEFSQSLSQIETEKVFARIVQEVIAELRQLASEKDYAFNDLACTLLVFIATPHWLGAMQIGDGFIVVRPQDSEDYQLLFQPDKGEFANETTFITSKDALAEMQVKVISEPQKFICASTDGL